MKKNLTRMETALQKLTQRDNADAFVIFSDNHSGRFLQFAGSQHENLLLVLPSQTLTSAQLEIASRLFQQRGANLEMTELLEEPDGEPAGLHFGFNLEFGHDYQTAARTALDLMCEIYSLDEDFDLLVEEN